MLFKFKSKACADLIMLEPDGRRILKAMIGQDPVKGIVQVADLPAALHRLQSAVDEDEARRKAPVDPQDGGEAAEGDQALPAVRLAQRAMPMLQMLQRCIDEEADLVWGV